jgi:hypothetical protein
MSTLVLILAAGTTVPGSGPEKVSAEMVQGLDLRGEWEGAFDVPTGLAKNARLNIENS